MKRILFPCFFLVSCTPYVSGYDGYTQSQLSSLDFDIRAHYDSYPKDDGSILGFKYVASINDVEMAKNSFSKITLPKYELYSKSTTSDGILKKIDLVSSNKKPEVMFVSFETLNGEDLPGDFVNLIESSIQANYGMDYLPVGELKLSSKKEYMESFILNRPSKDAYTSYKIGISDSIESISHAYDKSESRNSFNRIVYRINFVGY
ncbi:hypothetical protein JGC22_24850, partial [Salmonella enterica subsp. enterica serovar Agona]|nr:hypothetical protein [Salmonella enterica subsp. enterica serovar Agona]